MSFLFVLHFEFYKIHNVCIRAVVISVFTPLAVAEFVGILDNELRVCLFLVGNTFNFKNSIMKIILVFDKTRHSLIISSGNL